MNESEHVHSVVVVGSVYQPYLPILQMRVSHPIEVRVARRAVDEDVCPLLGNAEVVVTSAWTEAMRSAAPHLRFLQIPGAGWDKVSQNAIPAGVIVANCYEHEWAIAEYVLMVCLALSRQLIPADRALRNNGWEFHFGAGHRPYPELRGKVIGIVGLGRIGRAVARLGSAFQMSSIAVDISPPAADEAARIPVGLVVGPSQLELVLTKADFIVVSIPLNDTTRGMLGADQLGLLKPSAYLINTSRAEIIDEESLYQSLRNRSFAGAALDPWWFYPKDGERVAPSRLPFRDLDNVVMTPHYSGSTIETVERRMQVVADNIERFLAGQPLINVVRELSRA